MFFFSVTLRKRREFYQNKIFFIIFFVDMLLLTPARKAFIISNYHNCKSLVMEWRNSINELGVILYCDKTNILRFQFYFIDTGEGKDLIFLEWLIGVGIVSSKLLCDWKKIFQEYGKDSLRSQRGYAPLDPPRACRARSHGCV